MRFGKTVTRKNLSRLSEAVDNLSIPNEIYSEKMGMVLQQCSEKPDFKHMISRTCYTVCTRNRKDDS